MAITQAEHHDSAIPRNYHDFDLAQAVERGELVLSLSSMLGRDYIFVTHKGPHTLLEATRIEKTIAELLDLLEASPRQSMVVSADVNTASAPSFTRHDYTWSNKQVSAVVTTRVTHSGQVDFMRMMYDCSTTC